MTAASAGANSGKERPPQIQFSEEGGRSKPTPKSFRDMVMAGTMPVPERLKVDLLANKLVRIECDDGNRLLPRVFAADSVLSALSSPWKDSFIVKLLGKHLGYNLMKQKLHALWKPQGAFDILDVDHGFYMVRFVSPEDREKVLQGRPWVIFNHYVAVSTWTPDFVATASAIHKTMVWIHFPGLNLAFYDESFLRAMATAVGKPVKVDTSTQTFSRGRYARVCVEIDLSLPVVGKVWFRDNWFRVEYEGLHIICDQCGCYGHVRWDCGPRDDGATTSHAKKQGPVKVVAAPATKRTTAMVENGASDLPGKNQGAVMEISVDHAIGMEVSASQASDLEVAETKANLIIMENNEPALHGDWMVVKSKKSKKGNNARPSAKEGEKGKQKSQAIKKENIKNKSNKTGLHGQKVDPVRPPAPPNLALAAVNTPSKRRRGEDGTPVKPATTKQSQRKHVSAAKKFTQNDQHHALSKGLGVACAVRQLNFALGPQNSGVTASDPPDHGDPN
ncbi:uncharacterized protein LOC130719683 [Lotus japonicus]|uniref:uncharacterized protein LOC130719683 n=1 Tax=Lotus japonicus TaxID=34305 RepID=UPI00258ECAFD|nr:uncharacterized protein LOC130719683 [Lotus japonicus]